MRRHQPAPEYIRVVVSDDSRVHTELLADALRRDGCLQVTTSPTGSENLTKSFNPHDIDVLLISSNLDERLGRGFEVLRGLRASHGELKAVILLDGSHPDGVIEAFRAGARGIFTKNDSVEALGKCVRKVNEGQIWASNRDVATLVRALACSHNIRAVDARGLTLLSKRETEIVQGVARGLSNREIAESLHISQHTVKNALFRIFDKIGVSSRVELLFMTLSQEQHAQSMLQHFVDERAYENLNDEAARVACQDAANDGVLTAQIALAQFHAVHKSDSAVEAYMWYAIAAEQISQRNKKLAKELTLDQLLEAEQLVAERLNRRNLPSVTTGARPRPAKRLMMVENLQVVSNKEVL
jgi:DNA-binding NarL/FixJ family response regulator